MAQDGVQIKKNREPYGVQEKGNPQSGSTLLTLSKAFQKPGLGDQGICLPPQNRVEKVSLREWSTGDVAVFCSCRWPSRESSHGFPWSSG